MAKKSKIYEVSDSEFIKIINESNSFNGILKTFGMSHGRGQQAILKKRCNELNLDVSRFNKNGGGIIKRIDSSNIFVKNSSYTSTYHASKRIQKEKLIEYKCAMCENIGVWNGKKLSLQLDHINGDHSDNRLENLRFLCPNCHTQTETYCSKCRAK